MKVIHESLHKAHNVLNHDFCPWANRWVYWIKHPLACLAAAAIVAGSCGLFVNPVGFAILAAILLVGLLGAVWPWICSRGLSAEAEFIQTRCRFGDSALVQLRIKNRYPWPAWGLSIRRGFHDGVDESQGISLARVKGWSDTEFEWVFTPPSRGVFPQGLPQVDTAFPFGFWQAFVPIELKSELVVWPESVPLDAMPDVVDIQTREDQLTDRRCGDTGEMIGIRPYREGDSLRQVHWLQTARTGKLIVMERQTPATSAVRLLVDIDHSRHRFDSRRNSLEQALSIAASIIESMHRNHAFIELQIHEQLIPIGSSFGDLRRGLDALARVPADGIHCHHSCHFDQPTRCLPTIAVTTDLALRHHRTHPHVSRGERYIVVQTNGDAQDSSPSKQADCDCHSWLDVKSDEVLRDVLPARWRKACHVQ
ncbi:DUF58 domain-containing protein [Thalassoglobus sp. JC818]|uniref:DUF58 domain-containing protein n=1 Tax=Thalassoglobus sp. JC818 TaxID=3232136 RepID=UPI003459D979